MRLFSKCAIRRYIFLLSAISCFAFLSEVGAQTPTKGLEFAAFAEWNDPSSWSPTGVPSPTEYIKVMNMYVYGGSMQIDLGTGAHINQIDLADMWGTNFLVGTGPVGSQSLTLHGDGIISTYSAYGGGEVLINSQLILGGDAGAGNYYFGISLLGKMVVNGPVTGGSGGTVGEKTLEINQVTMNGVISDGGSVLGIDAQYATLAAQNTYTGKTSISQSLLLLVDYAISEFSDIELDVAHLYLGAGAEWQKFGTLSLTSPGAWDFSYIGFSGTSPKHIWFADSHELSWMGRLRLDGFEFGTDSLRFGTDASALTPEQLQLISISGSNYALGLDDDGYLIAIPEPSPIALGVLSLIAFQCFSQRRRFVKET